MSFTVISSSEDETIQCARDFASKLVGGEIILLSGDLGAGKTTFVKGVGDGLGITKKIISPTFTLMNIYNSKLIKINLVHIDTYRLKNDQDLIDIGVEDYLGQPSAVCVIEWPDKIMALLKNKKTLKIQLEHLSGSKRQITIG